MYGIKRESKIMSEENKNRTTQTEETHGENCSLVL
jgi:hypothetical protein